MGELIQKVMLDRPEGVKADLFGELHLLDNLVEDSRLGSGPPFARDGDLVKNCELHACLPATGEQKGGSNAALLSDYIPLINSRIVPSGSLKHTTPMVAPPGPSIFLSGDRNSTRISCRSA